MNPDLPKDELQLKWGTLKGWHFKSIEENPALLEAIEYYNEKVGNSLGAMQQDRSGVHDEAVCAIIDAINTDEVYLEWDGIYVTKDEAKKYVREYDG